MKQVLQRHFQIFLASIKCWDTEEKLDLIFYRPTGYGIALLGKKLNLTPTHLTVLGMICGLVSGWKIYHQTSWLDLVWASGLLILAGIFDSADGQLARMTGQSTKMGLILDGICDNIVFGSVYLGCLFYWGKINLNGEFLSLEFLSVLGLAVVAGFFHSWQCAALDFYNREYLFFGAAKGEGYWNPSVEELKSSLKTDGSRSRLEKFLERTRLTWLQQQRWATTRSYAERVQWKVILNENPDKMQSVYQSTQKHFLPYWRAIGTNAHTFWFILFLFLGDFITYLVLVDIFGMTLLMLALKYFQSKQDQKLRVML